MRQSGDGMYGVRPLLFAIALTWSAISLGQQLTVGSLGTPTGNFGAGPLAAIDLSSVANRDGSLTSVTFLWSAAPCPAAVKIRIARKLHVLFLHPVLEQQIAERGPFDVSRSTQTVVLTPPISVLANDVIAISSPTSCGGPVSGCLVPCRRGGARSDRAVLFCPRCIHDFDNVVEGPGRIRICDSACARRTKCWRPRVEFSSHAVV